MAAEHTDITASADMPDDDQKAKKTKSFMDKLGIKDENAGERIKEAADKAGVIGAIGSLVLGVAVWGRSNRLIDFFIGLIIAAAGVFASCVLVSVLYSYSDMMSLSIEQKRILKRLEAKKTEEQKQTQAGKQQPEAIPASDDAPAAHPPGTDSAPDRDITPFGEVGTEPIGPLRSEPSKPLEAVSADKVNRIAHFKERSNGGVICPVCLKVQTSDNDACYRCSCQFIYDNDAPGRKKRPA